MELEQVLEYVNGLDENLEKAIRQRSSPLEALKLFYEMTQKNKVKNIIEIGTFMGLSALFFAAACKKQGGLVFTINVSKEETEVAKNLLKGAGLDNVVFLVIDSLNVLPVLTKRIKNDYNLVYIDGWHSYNYCMNEYRITEEYINRENGIIIVDDYTYVHLEARDDGGVPRVVEELKLDTYANFFAYKLFGKFII